MEKDEKSGLEFEIKDQFKFQGEWVTVVDCAAEFRKRFKTSRMAELTHSGKGKTREESLEDARKKLRKFFE